MGKREAEVGVVVPIDGCLDLHTFAPAEVGEVVREYLKACADKGIVEVRIVHGKGIGNLRRSVHSVLEAMAEVESFRLAPSERGGWGATIVLLKGVGA